MNKAKLHELEEQTKQMIAEQEAKLTAFNPEDCWPLTIYEEARTLMAFTLTTLKDILVMLEEIKKQG